MDLVLLFSKKLRHLQSPPIIMITAYGDVEMAVTAMKNGAHDFFTKPIKLAELEKSIHDGRRDCSDET